MVSYCLGLHTQNLRLREVDLEPSPKRGSDKINMLKQGRTTLEEKKVHHTSWADMDPSTQRCRLGTQC